MHKLVRTLPAVLGLTIAATASAAVYRVQFSAAVRPLSFNSLPSLPFSFATGSDLLEVSFLVDDSTQQQFGDFSCSPSPVHCGAIGYRASGLNVALNGAAQSGWQFGVTSNSFFNGPIDLRGSMFFTPGGLADPQNAWLPLVHEAYPGAALNFGQMYTAVGGVGFTALGFSAVDVNGLRALGDVSMSVERVSEVPEPQAILLAAVGVVALVLSRNKGRRAAEA